MSEPCEGPERTVADADPPNIQGRPKRDRVVTDTPEPIRGVMGTACQEGALGNVGDPSRVRTRDPQQFDFELSGQESERAILPVMPGNTGGGKGPCFWHAFKGDEMR